MSYGELILPPIWTGRNKQTGRFLKGHVPANKGKKWADYMGKRNQRRCAKGWTNLRLYQPKERPDIKLRHGKRVVAIMDNGRWVVLASVYDAAEWLNDVMRIKGNRENIGRCCRTNQAQFSKTQRVFNTDHKYHGIRFYFEKDNVWISKIKQWND